MKKLFLVIIAIFSITIGYSSDIIVTTAEGVGAFNSSLKNVNVETFDNLPTGVNNNVVWENVGTFDTVNVKTADQYGGAPTILQPKGSQYAVEGLGIVNTTTLKLTTPSSYFGLYWSAGDAANDLKFYNSGVLVADFTTANLMNKLPASYYGNPIKSGYNSGADKSEPFGFINFIGDANTSWDTIVFGNNGGSGFEADNYTSRVNGWNPTVDGPVAGTPVTEVVNGTVKDISAIPNKFKYATVAPAAPAPPLFVCLVFAIVIFLQSLRKSEEF